MSPPQRIGVALVNWNAADLTLACIDSLLAGELVPWRILVVDNGSVDGSADRLRGSGRAFVLYESPDNLGFARGTNVAVERLAEQGADAVWILNNDTVVAPACLRNLAAALEADATVAAVTGKILYESPPGRIWYAGAAWRHWSLTAPHRGKGREDRGQFDEASDVGFISGCCLLARKDVLDRVGLFDESYFAYWEDADWCLRALRLGLRLRYEPAAVLEHKVSASIRRNTLGRSGGSTSPIEHYLFIRNRLLLIRRHATGSLQRLTAMTDALAMRALVAAGLAGLGRWDKLAALGRGVRDGFREAV